ncbi:hypothetical protein HZA86_03645 [Candidatus Uhrbacteria bacterium]|nr:hypothetical protein [Candidatus Uhrbacteria bacterium]
MLKPPPLSLLSGWCGGFDSVGDCFKLPRNDDRGSQPGKRCFEHGVTNAVVAVLVAEHRPGKGEQPRLVHLAGLDEAEVLVVADAGKPANRSHVAGSIVLHRGITRHGFGWGPEPALAVAHQDAVHPSGDTVFQRRKDDVPPAVAANLAGPWTLAARFKIPGIVVAPGNRGLVDQPAAVTRPRWCDGRALVFSHGPRGCGRRLRFLPRIARARVGRRAGRLGSRLGRCTHRRVLLVPRAARSPVGLALGVDGLGAQDECRSDHGDRDQKSHRKTSKHHRFLVLNFVGTLKKNEPSNIPFYFEFVNLSD